MQTPPAGSHVLLTPQTAVECAGALMAPPSHGAGSPAVRKRPRAADAEAEDEEEEEAESEDDDEEEADSGYPAGTEGDLHPAKLTYLPTYLLTYSLTYLLT